MTAIGVQLNAISCAFNCIGVYSCINVHIIVSVIHSTMRHAMGLHAFISGPAICVYNATWQNLSFEDGMESFSRSVVNTNSKHPSQSSSLYCAHNPHTFHTMALIVLSFLKSDSSISTTTFTPPILPSRIYNVCKSQVTKDLR